MRAILAVSAFAVGVVGCNLQATPPGMSPTGGNVHAGDPSLVELARVEGVEGQRPLLVVYPESPCSASASGVLLGADGRFLGAVAPGTGALISVPSSERTVTVISSVEVTAPRGVWYSVDEVRLPPFPSGLVLRPSRFNTRSCGSGQYFDVEVASKESLEELLEASPVRWFSPRGDEGQAWLDSHRPRVDEILGRSAPGPAPVESRVASRDRR